MQIWAGLGNPGTQYALTRRHNVGSWPADAIAGVHGLRPMAKEIRSLVSEGVSGATVSCIEAADL